MFRFSQHTFREVNIHFLSSLGQLSSSGPLLVFLMLLAQNMLIWVIPRHAKKEPMTSHGHGDQARQVMAEPAEAAQTRVKVDMRWTRCQEKRPRRGTARSV